MLCDNLSILVLAPHLQYPAVNGADILISERWAAIGKHSASLVMVGESEIRRFKAGKFIGCSTYKNAMRGKTWAALRTLALRSDYLLEKFVTERFLTQVEELKPADFDLIVVSFVEVAASLQARFNLHSCKVVIETHNNQLQWFRNFTRGETSGGALVAAQSVKWLEDKLPALLRDFSFIHVTDQDAAAYIAIQPHQHVILPVGVGLPNVEHVRGRAPSDRVQLLFSGSLSNRMNFDALVHFERTFQPALLRHFGERLSIVVAGSNPTKSVVRICRLNGWALHGDVSDIKLDELFSTSLFSILPFSYAAGSKLKLVKSLSYGVPVLTTECVAETGGLPAPCLTSDLPEEWVAACEGVSVVGVSARAAMLMRRIAEGYSWDGMSALAIENLQRLSF